VDVIRKYKLEESSHLNIRYTQELLDIAKQETNLPGREKDMDPIAKHTELELVDKLSFTCRSLR